MHVKTKKALTTKHPIATGIATGVALYGANKVIRKVGESIGVPLRHGRANNEHREEIFRKHPYLSALGITAVTPLTEELTFRTFPEKLAEKYPDRSRLIGLGALTLFTLGHVGKDGIPVPQALSGAAYSKLHKSGGLKAAYTAHATHNLLAVIDYAHKNRSSTE